MRFELTDLRVFVAIAEAGSLTMGASDMHLTAPSASYRLKNLEQTVGVPLFNRTQKGMVLTAAGETMLQHARTILDNVEQLQIGMRRHTDGIEGHIRVHANSSTMCNLPVALSRFLAAYPNVNVDLEEHLSADSVRAVLEQRADIGLVAGAIDLHGLDSILYGADELLFVVPPRHPLGMRDSVSLVQALRHELVSIGSKSSNFLYLQDMATRAGIVPHVRVHAPNFPAVIRCVQEGAGIALVPRSVAEPAIAQGLVEGVVLDEPWAMREQRVVARSLQSLPDYARAFIRFLTESGESLPAAALPPPCVR
ncbi:LysR family transcriptional regulator [Cupriavidus metallidurans]|uniref:LysR family transcriptional regulator n=1 Tax=Cupriavidus TaxID=106589 RepID=UPI000E9DE9B7|nr:MULTISPECIES: LysR family transcriptional regulator [unclassified Cupriavidus]GMG93031.1 LysR family transcriptional regulator [Cupriavidus sp. TKC]HBD35819.1 LysR family transcriptional regulator [Cupriavidus sp.]HBO81247.1 LysR family transcriptional regulator [Cupriavidus sp.]